MLVFLKLGGSLITDKREAQRFQADNMRQAAAEIVETLAAQADLRLLIGHGSGSFGHVAAQKHGTAHGVRTPEQWRGFAEVGVVARRLNALVLDALHEAGLPVFGVQPSASALCEDGALRTMDAAPIQAALDHGLVPLVHGDVALDSVRGGTIISTETIFAFLAERLHPARILLLGEVEGVYDGQGAIIPRITSGNFAQFAAALGGSHGTDVTGGMATKVRDMLALTGRVPGLQVQIMGGASGQLAAALRGEKRLGTTISQA